MPPVVTTPRERTLAFAAWIVVCIVWGTTYLAIRVALESVPVALVGGLRFKEYFQHFFLEPFVDRIEISDIQPADLESGLECVIDATLRLGFLPKLRILLEKMALDLSEDVSISVQPKPVPVSPQVPNNPALEQNEVRAFIDIEVS